VLTLDAWLHTYLKVAVFLKCWTAAPRLHTHTLLGGNLAKVRAASRFLCACAKSFASMIRISAAFLGNGCISLNLLTQACAICVLGPHAAWLQEAQEQVKALEGSMVEAHKRVMRACADMALAQQQAQVDRLHAQTLQVELNENTVTWQQEVVLRLEMEEECRRQATRIEQAIQNERAAVAAAEEGLQAHEGLVKQARLQQKRLGMLAHLKVRPRAGRPLTIVRL
jgi:hypothetical protein